MVPDGIPCTDETSRIYSGAEDQTSPKPPAKMIARGTVQMKIITRRIHWMVSVYTTAR